MDPPGTRRRRWPLFALSLLSLVGMTYAGVLVAMSVTLTPAMLDANSDLERGGRAIVLPPRDPAAIRTHAQTGEGGVYLVGGDAHVGFPSGATNLTLGHALAYVTPVNGTYTPANLTLEGVASREGTSDLTIDVAALAGGASGWIVMGSGESEPRFVPRERAVGEVVQLTSTGWLAGVFAAGLVGFLAPLVYVIATHRGAGPQAPRGAICRECRTMLHPNTDFCLRCGATIPPDAR